MGKIGDINETLYIETDGKIGFKKSVNRTSKGDAIGEAVGRYAVKPMEDEGNSVYENENRVRRIRNVSALVIADHASHKEQQLYRDFLRNSNRDAILSDIGYGNSAQKAANDMLKNNGFTGSKRGGHTKGAYSLQAGVNLTNTELSSLMQTGQFSRMIDGEKVDFTLNHVKADKVTATLKAADLESKRNARMVSAHGIKNHISTLHELRSASLDRLKAMDINVGSGSQRDLERAIRELTNARESAIEAGKQSVAATIEDKIAKTEEHLATFGGTELGRSNWSANKSSGMRMIAQNMMGSDEYQGMQKMRQIEKAVEMSVKTTLRAADSVAYGAESLAIKHTPLKNTATGQQLHDKHTMARNNSKARTKAHRSGNMKDYRENRREQRSKTKAERAKRSDDRFESKQNKLRSEGKYTKADRKDIRRNRKKERQGKLAAAKNNVTGAFGKISNTFGKITDKLTNNKLTKIIKAPLDGLGIVKDAIKKLIRKFVIIPIGIALIVVVLIFGILDILMYVPYFISENVETNLVGTLNNVNYVQLIVDDVAENLGDGFLEVAKRDAEQHYLDIDNEDAVPSDGIAWYKTPTNSELRHIYSTEDNKELSSLNDNLLPIISAMHFRYYDEINYLSWLTARGYAYYMYVATHNVLGYDYEESDNCAQESLYNGTVAWNVNTRTVSRPSEELCTNLYVHGYDEALNKEMNKAKASTVEALNKALSFLGLDFSFDSSKYGAFDEIPSDSAGSCTIAMPKQRGTREGTNKDSNNVDNDCGYVYHEHRQECYSLGCGKEEHTHGDGKCNTTRCPHKLHDSGCCSLTEHKHEDWRCGVTVYCGGCEKLKSECDKEPCQYSWFPKIKEYHCGYEYEHSHTEYILNGKDCNTDNCSHKSHDTGCCGVEVHTHATQPANTYKTTSDNDYNACWKRTCGKPGHKHDPWLGEANTGCWKTKYICPGHCGGHIIPQIDLEVDMSFKNIALYDNYKTTYYLSSDDFKESWIDKLFELKTIKEWKEYWNRKMASWFIPLPNSPSDIVENYVKWATINCAEAVDWITGKIAGLFGGGDSDQIKSSIIADAGEDLYDFDGWYNEDGTLNLSVIEDLESIYGKYENDYEEGVSAWEDFDVVFPIGSCRPMTATQKNHVKEILEQTYPSLSEERKSVINQAMDYVGKFWYDLSTKTGNAKSTSGRIDCSGFVSSVLYHSIGWSYDWTASGFANNGTSYDGKPSSLTPGDVIAMSKTAAWNANDGWGNGGTNHVVIFVGLIQDGVPGYPESDGTGYYIIDCSSGLNGSAIREVSYDFFKDYPYVYKGCY